MKLPLGQRRPGHFHFVNMHFRKKGFTLIELLVVIVIIGLLSTIVLVGLNQATAKARDAKRLNDMHQIITALNMYYTRYGFYPNNTDDDCSGWDASFGGTDTFINPLVTSGIMTAVPIDPKSNATCWGYQYYYYRYVSEGGCTTTPFFVLGIRNMETGGSPYPGSPGWKCPTRDWQSEFDWVTGGFEK